MSKKIEWVTITQAAQIVGIEKAKISRLVAKNELKSKKDRRLDMRATYVDLDEVKAMFPPTDEVGA